MFLGPQEFARYALEFKAECPVRFYHWQRWLSGRKLKARTYRRLRDEVGVPAWAFFLPTKGSGQLGME